MAKAAPLPTVVGLDPASGAGAAVALHCGEVLGASAWCDGAGSYVHQVSALHWIETVAPVARLVYEVPSHGPAWVRAAISRSVGIWLAGYPRDSAGMAPAKWRKSVGLPANATKQEAIQWVRMLLRGGRVRDPRGELVALLDAGNDHAAEACLIGLAGGGGGE